MRHGGVAAALAARGHAPGGRDSGAAVLLHAPALADAAPTVLGLGLGSASPDLIALATAEANPPVT